MAVRFTLDFPRANRLASGLGMVSGTFVFDSPYTYGGETVLASVLQLRSLTQLMVEGKGGLNFVFDGGKVKVFGPAPPIVYEEKKTAVSNLVTLDYPAAWIINVARVGANQAWADRTMSLSANQFKLESPLTAGVRTRLVTAGATDTIYVTYVTQAWQEVFQNLVQEEVYTAVTGNNNLANRMLAFGYCHRVSATAALLAPTDPATSAGAGRVGITFNSPTAQVNHNSGENGSTCKITYLRVPASGFLLDRLIPDEDPTKSGSDPYLQTFDRPLLMWCISGCFLVNNAGPQYLVTEGEAPTTGFAHINWGHRGPAATGAAPQAGFVIAGKSNVTCTSGTYLWGHPWEIPGLVPLEVRHGTNLMGIGPVRFTAFGTL